MKDFATKAEEAIPCVRVQDADVTAYRITQAGLVSADEIGNDDYPQYGDWLPCEALDADGNALGERYLEAPGALAAELVRIDADTGTCFRLAKCSKTDDGQWSITVETLQYD